MPLISNSPSSFPSCQVSCSFRDFIAWAQASTFRTLLVTPGCSHRGKLNLYCKYYAEETREQKRRLWNTRTCELSKFCSLGPFFWKGTFQEIKSPQYHGTQVASRTSTWERCQFQGTLWSPLHEELYTHCVSLPISVEFHFSTQHPETIFLQMEKLRPHNPEIWQVILHTQCFLPLSSPSHFVTGPRSSAMISPIILSVLGLFCFSHLEISLIVSEAPKVLDPDCLQQTQHSAKFGAREGRNSIWFWDACDSEETEVAKVCCYEVLTHIKRVFP